MLPSFLFAFFSSRRAPDFLWGKVLRAPVKKKKTPRLQLMYTDNHSAPLRTSFKHGKGKLWKLVNRNNQFRKLTNKLLLASASVDNQAHGKKDCRIGDSPNRWFPCRSLHGLPVLSSYGGIGVNRMFDIRSICIKEKSRRYPQLQDCYTNIRRR